jgi:hypothetical protein
VRVSTVGLLADCSDENAVQRLGGDERVAEFRSAGGLEALTRAFGELPCETVDTNADDADAVAAAVDAAYTRLAQAQGFKPIQVPPRRQISHFVCS